MVNRAKQFESNRGPENQRARNRPDSDWRAILLRTKRDIAGDHLSIIAAGVAFYALLALFPAIGAIVSMWGLAFDPQQIEQQLGSLSGLLPPDAASLVTSQAHKVASNAGSGLTLAAMGGLLLAIWSATKGTKALMEGLNIVHDKTDARGFLMLNVVALTLTLYGVVGVIVALGLIAVLPALLDHLGFANTIEALLTWLRWPLLFAFALAALTVIYRYAPSRDNPSWRWVSLGAAAATLLWVIGSLLFSLYVHYFGSYNKTYGSIGAVIVLLVWFWLTAYIVLAGAEFSAAMEHRKGRNADAEKPEPDREG